MSRTARGVLIAVAAVLVLGGAALVVDGRGGSDSSDGDVAEECRATTPDELLLDTARRIDHDPTAYTQGLVFGADGRLFESTGRVGESTLREVDPETGEVLHSEDLPAEVFGEGLTTSGDELVQLTWTDEVAYRWNADGTERVGEFGYSGEGWGITTLEDGTLVTSDGSSTLVLRDPDDFSETARIEVTRSGGDTDRLNELEFDGEWLWANRYQTDELLRIDPECGTVTGVADLGSLRTDAEQAAGRGAAVDVTNGIAQIPGTDRYLVTGKWWPTMYEVRFEPR